MDKVGEDDSLYQGLLSSFYCKEDEDIEVFLREKAVEFERLAKSRTYLIIDEEELQERRMAFDKFTIYGYISLAIKILKLPETVSNRKRKELDGFSAKAQGKQLADFPCYLIGQLARNSNVPKDSISGKELLDFAYRIIAVAVEVVGGRYILIECHDNKKLIEFYSSNGFSEISRIADQDKKMVQMIRKIE